MSTGTVLIEDGVMDGVAPAAEPEPETTARPKKAKGKGKPKPKAVKVAEAHPAPASTPRPKVRKAPSDGLPPDSLIRDASILLKQASDPTRLKLLLLLGQRPRNVGELCDALGMASQPAVSHHLSLGRSGGLWEATRSGKNNIYALKEKGEALARIVTEMVK